jgi:hypothetical protein
VAETRGLIASELADNLRNAIIRVRAETCGERRLDELGAILDNAAKTGVLPAVGDIGIPARGIWNSGAWESAVASQAAVHFPHRELAGLGAIYKFIEKADGLSVNENTQWNELYAMVGPGRRLDPASEARLRGAMSQARGMNRLMTQISENILRLVKALDLPFSSSDLNAIAAGESQSLVKSRNEFSLTGQVCGPIEAVPAVYGQASWNFVPYRNAESLKALPNFRQTGR